MGIVADNASNNDTMMYEIETLCIMEGIELSAKQSRLCRDTVDTYTSFFLFLSLFHTYAFTSFHHMTAPMTLTISYCSLSLLSSLLIVTTNRSRAVTRLLFFTILHCSLLFYTIPYCSSLLLSSLSIVSLHVYKVQ